MTDEWVTLEEIDEMQADGINGTSIRRRLFETARSAHKVYEENEELRRKLEGANARINALMADKES